MVLTLSNCVWQVTGTWKCEVTIWKKRSKWKVEYSRFKEVNSKKCN